MSIFQRTAKRAAPEALRSSGSPLKSMPSRQLNSSMGARWLGARCAWTSRKTALARPGKGEISGRRPTVARETTPAGTIRDEPTPDATNTAGMISLETTSTEATTTARATAMEAGAAGPSKSRSAPKAVGAASAARSAACRRSVQQRTAKKYSGEV